MLWDENSQNCLDYSPVILRIHNLTASQYLRRISAEKGLLHVAQEDRETLENVRGEARRHVRSYDIKYRILDDDDQLKWIHEISQPFDVEGDKLLTSIRSMQDVTDDILKREQLEREMVFIQQIERAAGLGVFVWDIETQRNLYCSDNLIHLHGMELSELEATADGEQGDVDMAVPQDRARLATEYENSRLYGTPIDIEYRYNHPQKGLRWFHEIASRRNLGEGKRQVTMGVLRDITDRKRIEQRVHEQRIIASEAERTNLAKSEFLSNMSHELRTPMNAVLGFAQMLQHDPKNSLTPMQHEHVDSILKGGYHLLDLINEILDLAKIESDQLRLVVEEIDAGDVIAGCVALSIPLGQSRNINLIHKQNPKSAPLMLRTDRTRFTQALLNLLSNAVKYNKDGGTVTVDCWETDEGFCRIAVVDTGIGITRRDYDSVFQMFHRLGIDAEITREGTGIGLTVTKLLVERMAGQVGFESEEGVGSTFWIELPMTTNKKALIWSDILSVGINAIDKDHQVIFRLLNKLTNRTVNDSDLDNLIEELADYMGHHFRREEAIMEVCNDPKLAEHSEHHRVHLAELSDKISSWHIHHDMASLRELRQFLRNWQTGHIMNMDCDISRHTCGKEQLIRAALAQLK